MTRRGGGAVVAFVAALVLALAGPASAETTVFAAAQRSERPSICPDPKDDRGCDWEAALGRAMVRRAADGCSRGLGLHSVGARRPGSFRKGRRSDPAQLAHAREALRAQGTGSAAERERSRSAYRDLSGSSASRLARRVFGGYMHAPGWVPVAMAEGQRLGRYRSDSVVEIRNADGTSGGLVDSSLPLVAPDGAGIKKPVDLSLGVDDGALVPRNPLVGTRIGQEIADGIRIDKLGLRLPGERSSGTVVGGRVLFV